MAVTRFGVNDTNAVKLWAKRLEVEALKATPIAPLMGKSSDSIIHVKTETSKGAGDKVTFSLRMQLSGDGVSESETLEGNEEALSLYADSIVINELSHAVKVAGKRRIDTQRILFNLREEARSGLRDWFAKRMSVSFFNQVAGNTLTSGATAPSSTKYTGLQAAIAPSSSRHIYCSVDHTTEATLDSTDPFQLKYLDYAKELAKTASVPIRPLMIGGQEKYVCYLHPYQVTDLRTDASTAGNWFDIQKAGLMGGKISNNPIYTGALGEYNGVILRDAYDLPCGNNSGAAITTVRRAVFLGAQACAMAFGQRGKEDDTSYEWVEDTFDFERMLGISVQSMFGMKKTQFNSVDFGTIVLSSYAAAHTS